MFELTATIAEPTVVKPVLFLVVASVNLFCTLCSEAGHVLALVFQFAFHTLQGAPQFVRTVFCYGGVSLFMPPHMGKKRIPRTRQFPACTFWLLPFGDAVSNVDDNVDISDDALPAPFVAINVPYAEINGRSGDKMLFGSTDTRTLALHLRVNLLTCFAGNPVVLRPLLDNHLGICNAGIGYETCGGEDGWNQSELHHCRYPFTRPGPVDTQRVYV